MFRSGYILGARADRIWFLGLPFVAVGFAMVAGHWLPFAVLAALHIWVTIPHHYATWLRTYGDRVGRERFRGRLILGPLLILSFVALGTIFAPLMLFVVIRIWDVQHGLMQQHGFGRIYDFKAKTGAPSTRQFDLGLHAVLYVNMILASPLFTQTFWVPGLYSLGFAISPGQIEAFQQTCWSITAAYVVVYAGHVYWSVINGYALNPVKYLFIGASYFLWYFTAWQTNSVLIWGIAHKLMHGLQYIVMVNGYLQRQAATSDAAPTFATTLFQPSHLYWLLGSALAYAAAYQLLVSGSLSEFGFGFIPHGPESTALGEMPLLVQLRVMVAAEAFQLVHFYFDSFVWKVSDKRVQSAL